MEPPLFHDNRDYATNLFAGYGPKATEKRQNQPQMSRIKTDFNRGAFAVAFGSLLLSLRYGNTDY
jgi:hypothetical protein